MAKKFHPGPDRMKRFGPQSSFAPGWIAMWLMVAGAAGFVVSLLFLGGQDVFLFGSTLVTFVGLGLNYGVRRFGWGRQARPERTGPLNSAPMVEDEPPGTGTLLDRVLAIAARDGARAKIEVRQDNRAILRVTSRDGKRYTTIVDENPAPVDVAGVRALFALMNQNQSVGGYLISAGPFTPQAYRWANSRRIRLVQAVEMDPMGF